MYGHEPHLHLQANEGAALEAAVELGQGTQGMWLTSSIHYGEVARGYQLGTGGG